ncbi:MAG: hypothetical protein LBS54_09210 [Dysgonamonadaceae bacterium]|nr:hypothetical protein [Dysgonamonadaceae bacterium]
MNKPYKIYLLLLLCTVFPSCTKDAGYWEESLIIAGTNRRELQKVLAHYSKESDSLKLRAAEFLIGNMAGHFSYAGNGLEQYYDAVDSLTKRYVGKSSEEISAAFDSIGLKFGAKPGSVYDLQVIKADYLLKNIDSAFDLWQNGDYARHLTFDDFCEYLLPYKICEFQTLDNWREYLSASEYGDLQYLPLSSHSNHSAYWACDKVNLTLSANQPKTTVNAAIIPLRRMNTLLSTPKKKDCDDLSVAAAAVMRAKGIPVMTDFTPQWPNRKTGHSWCVVLDNSGKNRPFEGMHFSGANAILNLPLAKVFRYCYAINPEMVKLNNKEKTVPEWLKNICIKDVTDEYQQTDNLEIPIKQTDNRYAYLAVFDNKEWFPVHYGKINGKKAQFEKMGRDAVYLPLVYTQKGIEPLAEPFILTLRGEIKPVIPDTKNRQTLKLYRKHPAMYFTSMDAQRTIGGKFQAANRADFSDAITVHTINRHGTESDEILLGQTQKYRYWRHLSAPKGHGAMAEIYFFSKGENITGNGKVIGTTGDHPYCKPERLFDSDPVTFLDIVEPSGGWAGLDFGSPVNIDRILYIPKCDGNGVTWDDTYELSYWDNNRWNSLGKKQANNIFIEFENCPQNALFILHDLTRGVEERIFTYENGKQIWW